MNCFGRCNRRMKRSDHAEHMRTCPVKDIVFTIRNDRVSEKITELVSSVQVR